MQFKLIIAQIIRKKNKPTKVLSALYFPISARISFSGVGVCRVELNIGTFGVCKTLQTKIKKNMKTNIIYTKLKNKNVYNKVTLHEYMCKIVVQKIYAS